MTSKSKVKGNNFEREIVKTFTENGLQAKRAWASNGESMGQHKEVDVLMTYKLNGGFITSKLKPGDFTPYTTNADLKIQCKRKKQLPEWLGFSEHVDSVCFKEDRGDKYIMFRLEDFIKRFLV
jgi:hypothetical protein